MELSCREVPLYGQVTAYAVLETTAPLPEEAECYLVYEGSSQDHITEAQIHCDGNTSTLHFVVPGHNQLENVSVTAYIYMTGHPIAVLARSSVTYIPDKAHELARFLVDHSHCLTASSHLTLLKRFGLSGEARGTVDDKTTLTLAHLEFPYSWNVLGSQAGEELRPRESLLHLSVRLGLFNLSQFLLCQPGGLIALSLPNEDGATPEQLAIQTGNQALVELLRNPPNPLVTALAGISEIQADSGRLLKFFHLSEALTLTVTHGTEWTLEAHIQLLRKHLKDNNFLIEVTSLKINGLDGRSQMEYTEGTADKGSSKDLCGGAHTLLDNVFEEQLVLSVDEEDVDHAQLNTEKVHSSQEAFQKARAQPTFHAAARLSAMLSGNDEIYANAMLVDHVDDMDIKYSIDGTTTESTSTDSSSQDLSWGIRSDTGSLIAGPPASNHMSERCNDKKDTTSNTVDTEQLRTISAANLALARLNQPQWPLGFNKGGGPPDSKMSEQSPSLDGLDVDSEEEDHSDKSPLSNLSSAAPLQVSSGDEQDSFNTSPELSDNRMRSSSAYITANSKEPVDSGVRLRSYSYSSPKITLARPRFIRDSGISHLSEDGVFNSGRSLLQALSLSKSVSLLHPGKQRAYSLPEQPREKRELNFRKWAQSAEEEGSPELAESLQHLTLSEFLKEIEEEEWDKYIIPSKCESEKFKVSRTISFLKSRMSSTRNKNKGKNKDKEGKDKLVNGHQFITGSCSGLTLCLVCDKPAIGKELLQCFNCTISVHKGCRDSTTPCLKQKLDKHTVAAKNKPASSPQSSAVREIPSPAFPAINTSSSLPVGTSWDGRRDPSLQGPHISKSMSAVSMERRLNEEMDSDGDSASWRSQSHSEETLQLMGTSPSTDSYATDDTVDAPLRSDLGVDSAEYEAESWSLAVDQKFCSKQEKHVIKRQDVIYELMQTEMHHIQTLLIMSEVFRKGMKEEVQLDPSTVAKIFPCLDELLHMHSSFFGAMKGRRQDCAQEDSDRNFLIHRIGDVLVHQFSEENAMRMKQVYGEFCSRHIEAVNLFKELQQQNKKFQAFIKQQSNNFLARRREVPECILLVTQRITKYPVLLERILQYSKEGKEEHADLTRALGLIKDIIAAVDLKVSEYEKEQKLLEILNRIENKTFAKLKNGNSFRKQDLRSRDRTLQHEGLVYWKTATGRLKDVMALLLTDVLIFLQEKDQRYVFAAVDQKPPVISLQKLIVREVANEERGMFLISASSAGPEMYEIHTASKEERNSWMRHIREAVESCPEEEEERTSETEEDRRIAEARAQKILKLQETLSSQDQQICNSLEDKLRIYAELTGMSIPQESVPEPHLLIRPDPEDVPQAAMLLTAALREAEKLTATLTSQPCGSSSQSQESLGEPSSPMKLKAFGSFSSIPESPTESDYLNTQSSSSVSLSSDSEIREGEWSGAYSYILQSLSELKRIDSNNTSIKNVSRTEVAQSVQSLTQLLYSLQAAVTIQDSCFEVQKLLLLESERMPRLPGSRGNLLQEQEKQRNVEKQREELAGVQRLKSQMRLEQQRWERECDHRQRQQREQESRLEQRERECHLQAERLQHEREELESQLQEYQHNLERLREGQRLVEKEREKLDSWKHGRQSSLPVMFPVDSKQVTSHCRSGSFEGDGSVFVNEAALQMSLNNHHRSSSFVYPDTPTAHNSLNSLIARTSENQTNQRTDFPYHPLASTNQNWRPHSTQQQIPAAVAWGHRDRANNETNTHCSNTDKASVGQGQSASSPYQGYSQSLPLHLLIEPQNYISLQPENGQDGSEENIVYL
ncbi:rho guanine nucleotide exchange factor 28-like isoform X1 [Acipenser ruthenus]|uniref:rho guanine nucleotide exchange factor 28-like isoform X1 n=1 Tax=Acipenser ruthenus TaxID=7906 RepID=UPI0027429592|nr:rho guanine nucleotide exchange factor 28-like isoform X1 [Acipenser ruthenus]